MLTLPLYLNKNLDTLPLDKNVQKKRVVGLSGRGEGYTGIGPKA